MRHAALHTPAMVTMWIVVFFALLSAMSYFRKFWGKVDKRIKLRRRRELLMLERKRQNALMRQRASLAEGLEGATILKPPDVN
jgi:CDP-diacylglycerol--glycerol-3-phosphate 3-phosphatidyltransferase